MQPGEIAYTYTYLLAAMHTLLQKQVLDCLPPHTLLQLFLLLSTFTQALKSVQSRVL
jgi:hypothetical protein